MRFWAWSTVSASFAIAFLLAAGPAARADPRTLGAPVVQPGPFTLHRADGTKLDGVELDGRPYGVLFGFTHCPDVCPTALAEVTAAFRLSPNVPADFRVYFVAVDDERDTPGAVAAYLSAFDPRIVGLTGARNEIALAAQAFGAVARRRDLPGGNHTMEHTAALFLVDSNGVIADRVAFAEAPDAIAARIAAAAAR